MYVRIITFVSSLVLFSLTNLFGVTHAVTPENAKKNLSLVVKLSDIKVEKTSHKSGDQIFFSMTEYSSLGRSKENRIPVQPVHWLSQNVDKVKDVVLWQGSIQEGEEIKLIISLMEQDLPPWNPDDLIGSAELTVKNEKGIFHKEWKIPIYEETSEVEMKNATPDVKNSKGDKDSIKEGAVQRFVFKGEHAKYDVAFDVQAH